MKPSIAPLRLASFPDRPWLVLGKGPSLAHYRPEHGATHNVVVLNHAMRSLPAAIGHVVDIEVLEDFGLDLLERVQHLCLPWIPHVRQQRPFEGGRAFFGPGRLTLEDYARESPVLAAYAARGRLLSYNLMTAPPERRHPGLPLVQAGSFSAAVVIELLAGAGAREIRSLGVDGGRDYAATLRDLEGRTKLQTGQTSYDAQFADIAATLNRHELLCGPLDAELPARVFVGCEPQQDLAFAVLEYSIRRHASISVRVERLHEAIAAAGIGIPEPKAPENRARTPFSFQRFAIPAVCGRRGRAIYLDSDMLVLDDLRKLWLFGMDGRALVSAASPPGSQRRPQFSVMLLDCHRLGWDVAALVQALDEGHISYEALMYEMATVPDWAPALPASWNSLEHYEPGRTSLVHFTDMDGQPWLNPLHPYGELWCGYLLDAVGAGAIAADFVRAEVRRGHVRPSLAMQLELGLADPRRLPFKVLSRDLTEFLAPHRRRAPPLSRLKHELYRAAALARHAVVDGVVRRCWRGARRAGALLKTELAR